MTEPKPVELTEAEMDAVELADILGRLLHSGGLARTAARHSLMKALEGWVSPKRVKAREAAARRGALLEAATEFEEDAADAWGGNAPWMTTGVRVANLAAEWLRESAAALAEPERDEESR
jgi:hypothetical protein